MSIRRCLSVLLAALAALASGASAQTLSFVDAAGRPATFLLEGTAAALRVEDAGASGSLQVGLAAELSGDQEMVALQETAPGSGVFTGSIRMRTGPALAGNGWLETTSGGPPYRFDSVQAEYANGPQPVTATVPTIGSLTSFRDEAGGETAVYALGETLRVRVEDHNFDDPGHFDTVNASVRSLATGDAEPLLLQETAPDSAIFEGTLATAQGPPSPGDGRLQAQPDEAIEASHTDSNGLLASGAQATLASVSLSFRDDAGRPTSVLLEGGSARVRAVSSGANLVPYAVDHLTVVVESQQADDHETLELTETGADTGVFEGSLPMAFSPGLSGNGTLETLNSGGPDYLGDQVTARSGPYAATAHTVPARVVFLDPFGRETSVTPLGAPLRLRVTSHPSDSNPFSRDSFTVMLLGGCGDFEYLSMEETGFHTGVFEGRIDSVPFSSTSSPNGVLNGRPGCEVVATFQGPTTPHPVEARVTFSGGSLTFVDAQGELTGVFLVGTRAYLRAVVPVANGNPTGADTIWARITSEITQDSEMVELRETGPNTGVFQGWVPLRSGQPPFPNDGRLAVEEDQGPPHRFDTLHAELSLSAEETLTATATTLNASIQFVDDFGAETHSYPQGARVRVRMEDHAANVDSFHFDTAYVLVRSELGDQEPLVLQETGKDTGIFEGSLELDSLNPPSPGDGRIQAPPGAGITAERSAGYTAEPARATIAGSAVAFIDEAGRPTSLVLENGLARVRVVSIGSNQNRFGVDSATALVESRYGNDHETVPLTETGADTGVFEGSIPLSFNPGLPGNGTLETLNSSAPEYGGDELTARFEVQSATAHTSSARVVFLDAYGRETSVTPLGSPLRLRVTSYPSDNDPFSRDSFSVMLQGCGDFEYLSMIETGFHTGIFEGRIDSVPFSANSSPNGVLNGQPGCEVTASFQGPTTPNPVQARATFSLGGLAFVNAQGELTEVFLVGTRAYLRAVVPTANGNPSFADMLVARITSEITQDFEQVELQETGPNTGVFQGWVLLRSGQPPIPNDGRLAVEEDQGPPHQFDTLHAELSLSPQETLTATASTLNSSIWFVDGFGAVTQSYPQGARVRVRMEDHAANVDSFHFDTAYVLVRSELGDQEPLVLQETGKDTGVFEGSLELDSLNPPSPGDGRIQAPPGAAITAERSAGFTAEPARATIDASSVTFIDESGRPTTVVLENGVARLRVVSTAANQNRFGPDSATALVESRYGHDHETVTLTETGADTGVFEGSIRLSFNPGLPGNGTLETLNSSAPEYGGDELTARFEVQSAMARTSSARFVFLDAYGRETTVTPLGSPLRLRVTSYPSDNDPFSRESFSVMLQGGCGDIEYLTLMETGFHTGIFEGWIDSVPFSANSSPNGVYNGRPGCEVTAIFQGPTTPNQVVARMTFSGGALAFVNAQGQLAEAFLVGTRAYLQAVVPVANGNPAAVDTLVARITAEITQDSEQVELRETGPNTGVFQGWVVLRSGLPPNPNDGHLVVEEDPGPPHLFDTLHAELSLSAQETLTATASTLNSAIEFVNDFGAVTHTYPQGARVRVRMEDHAANVDSFHFDVAYVLVRSELGDQEPLALQETGKDTGVFEGSLDLDSLNPPSPGDGRLQAPPGAGITAERSAGFTAEPARATIDASSVAFIDESGRPTALVLENGLARVRVVSTASNQNRFGPDSATALVESRYGNDHETVTLTETGADTNVFEGSIPLSFNPGLPGNGTLETLNSSAPEYAGDELTARFEVQSATARTSPARVTFLDAYGRETSVTPLGSPLRLRVTSYVSDNDPFSHDSFPVMLQGCGDFEYLTMEETGFHTGIFEGRIDSVSFSANSSPNGVFNGQPGCEVTASFNGPTTPNPTEARTTFSGGGLAFVDAQGALTDAFLVGTRAYLRAVVPVANGNPSAVDLLVARVTSEITQDSEPVELRETGPSTGVFQGWVLLRSGVPPVPNDGRLAVEEEVGPPHQFDTLHAELSLSPEETLTATASTLNSVIRFVDAYGAVTSSYPQGARVRVRMEDHAANVDGFHADVVYALVRSELGDQEPLVLQETGNDTGVFEGSLQLDSLNPPSPDDGRLQAPPGVGITAERSAGFTAEPAQARIEASAVLFIDESGLPTVEVMENGMARVRVVSTGSNQNPSAPDTATALVESLYGHDHETVEVTETGADTGVFEGSIPLSFSPGLPGNGTLETLGSGAPEYRGDELTARFETQSATAHTIGSRVFFLDAEGRNTTSIPLGEPVRLRVLDFSRNVPGIVDSFPVMLLGCDFEFVTLTETGPDTGVFEGQIDSVSFSSTSSPDGVYNGFPGCEVVASHQNANSPNPTEARATFASGSVRFIDAQGAPAVEFLEGTDVRVRVVDHGADRNPSGADSVAVELSTDLSADRETLTLAETGPATGVFEGSIPLVYTSPGTQGDGILQSAEDPGPPSRYDSVHALYTDAIGAVAAARAGLRGERTAFVDESGAPAAAFPLGSRAYVLLEDHRFNDPGRADRLYVDVRSASGDQEFVEVNETGLNTSLYTGSIELAAGAPAAGDGRLQTAEGEEITARRHGTEPADPARAQVLASLNRPPVAVDDAVEAPEGGSVSFRVLDNDSDPDGDPLVITSLTQPSHGTLDGLADGTLIYHPAAGFNGADSFTYTIQDPHGASATATVTIIVVHVNDAPLAVDDAVTVDEDGTVFFAVLANDSDPEGGMLVIASLTQSSHGTLDGLADGTLIYRPAADFNGADSFTYTIQDPEGATATATVRITVNPVNDPPVAKPDAGSADEDNPVTVAVLANDTDPEGDTLTVVSTDHQGAVVNPDGTVTFTPAANGFGDYVVHYTVSDGHGGTAVGTVTFTIREVNDPPVAVADVVTTGEDAVGPFNLLANDTDPEGEALHIVSVTQPAHGTATLRTGGRVDYQGAPNFNGQDSFTYTVADARGATATATVSVTVVPSNDPPVAVADSATVAEDGSVVIPVLANDTDVDGETLRVFSYAPGAHGTVTLNADQTLTYTPAPNYSGTDTFVYRAADAAGANSQATVTVTITPVNDPPVANADSATVAEDGSVSVPVLANDTDPDGDTLTVSAVTQGAHGTVTINPDKTVKYVPAANYNGPDSFTYTASDGNGGTATATVTVTVSSVNDAPVANADSAAVAEDGSVSVPVLANDTDPDGDNLTVSAVTQGAHGTVTINPDKTVKYVPAANYNGPDSFTYTASDGNGGTATAPVAVTVTSVNDVPVANADSAAVAEDGSVSVPVLANDSDPDGDTLTVSAVTQGAHGTVAIGTGGSVTYTPAANYNGADSFTYTASDGNGGTATAKVTVTVTSVNDAPVANADSASVSEDGSVSVPVLANDSDPDGDTLTVSAVTQGAHGSATISGSSVIYTPAANYNGPDSFTYTISDGHGGTATATVAVTVSSVNDAPIANPDSAAVAEDGSVSVPVLANDSDPDGDTLTLSAVTQGAHGSATISGSSVIYMPAANYNGSDAFTYTISDGHGGTATATVAVSVSSVNDAPIANADSAAVAEDGSVSVPVLANDSDLDGDSLVIAALTQGAHGTVAVSGGSVTYTPAANYNGPDAFTYTVSDGHGGSATAGVSVTVTPVNDPPVAAADSASVAAGSSVTIAVLANDSDVDSPSLTVTGVTQGTRDTATVNANGTITYTAGLSVGSDAFTYTVSDGQGGTATGTVTVAVGAPPRVATGLQARYDFNEGSGSTVNDTSGVGTALNLKISTLSAVSWVAGGLSVNSTSATVTSDKATKIISAAQASNAVTVEAWLTPANLTLTGPARILVMSKNSAQRNLVFGQTGNRYESQTKLSSGTASLQSPAGSLTLGLTHVVYTRSSTGQATYYVNGVQVSSQTAAGTLSWGSDQTLALADGWQGTYYLMAIYGRALSAAEVQQNYLAGSN